MYEQQLIDVTLNHKMTEVSGFGLKQATKRDVYHYLQKTKWTNQEVPVYQKIEDIMSLNLQAFSEYMGKK